MALQTPAMPDAVRRMASLSADRRVADQQLSTLCQESRNPGQDCRIINEPCRPAAIPVRSAAVVPALPPQYRAGRGILEDQIKAGWILRSRNASTIQTPLAARKART